MTMSNDKSHPVRNMLDILILDPWLSPYANAIHRRHRKFEEDKKRLLGDHPSLSDFANAHLYFGFHFSEDGCFYREWAPEADALFLMGDFNGWNENTHPLHKKENGIWEIFIPSDTPLSHLSLVKTVVWKNGRKLLRIPLYIQRIYQDPGDYGFAGQIWNPPSPFVWNDDDFHFDSKTAPLIYEAHVGMAQEKEAIGNFVEFADQTLPRIRGLGYNCIQLMAIMSHPYYASFGYHVSNFFAVSSWMGTPDELKYLIDKAHRMGIAVLMDIVHSHAVKNTAEGICQFDGSDYQFFHSGDKGTHAAWDSKLFDYGKPQVLHFLLSNVKYWLTQYHFDGFRFDGVTSMLYHHHGLGIHFDCYDKYFGEDTDEDAVTYLQFANELIHELQPDAVTIAEDMSGMPGMCLPIREGGIGFDYRLSMGTPDFWIRILDRPDEDWSMQELWYELTTKRPQEKRIAYVESHDQALVGDKTLIFRLTDQEMYWHMDKADPNLIVDRAIALHKIIRFVTLTLGGDGYLNFMGNEFGHPEWIDFPREGNHFSYKYCRRQWSLVDNGYLKYEYLNEFDKDMIAFVKAQDILLDTHPAQLWVDDTRKLLIYRRADCIFVCNFHPNVSYRDFELPTHEEAKYRILFHSDLKKYGGFERFDQTVLYESKNLSHFKTMKGIQIYSPSRTVFVLQKISKGGKD